LRRVTPRSVSMKASPTPSSICLTAIPPPMATSSLPITSPQPLSHMALGTAMVIAAPPWELVTCLPVRLPNRALPLVLALPMYSGFDLSLRFGFGKMIC